MSDPAKYRTKEEVETYKQKDPVEMIRKEILSNKIANETELTSIDQKVKEVVSQCVSFAEQSAYPTPDHAYTDVYADPGYPFIED